MQARAKITWLIVGGLVVTSIAIIFVEFRVNKITVYKLDPDGLPSDDAGIRFGEFHGYQILDSARVRNRNEVEKIKTAIQSAIDDGKDPYS